MENSLDQAISNYTILSELGRGGMAIVYKAYQANLDRYVALKVLPPQFTFDADFVKRFQNEARAAAKLNHPNIVTTYDVGAENGTYYIVMQLLEGITLAELIRREGQSQPARAAHILAQVAAALDYAHAQGFIHRDVKPGNVIVDSHDHATLTDFGIAKAAEGTRMTQSGMMMGTPLYMAPEQIRGGMVNARSDEYALGIVCYEMLTGRVPFDGDTARVLYAQVNEPPPPLHSLNSRILPAIEQVVNKALAKEPAQRFASAGEFAKAFDDATKKVSATGPSSEPASKEIGREIVPAWKSPRRLMRGAAVLGTALVLLLVLSLFGNANQTLSPPVESTETQVVVENPTLPTTHASEPTVLPTRTALPVSALRQSTSTRALTNTAASKSSPADFVYPAPVLRLLGGNNATQGNGAEVGWAFADELKADEWFDLKFSSTDLSHVPTPFPAWVQLGSLGWTKERRISLRRQRDELPFPLDSSGGFLYVQVIRGQDGKWLSDASPLSNGVFIEIPK